MTALLWKDFRLNLPIAVASAVVWAIIHAFLILTMLFFREGGDPPAYIWGEALTTTNTISLAFSQLLVGALGANAIACERADRSAEFLFALPPTRVWILMSKLILALALALGVWGAHLFMLEVIVPVFGILPATGNPRLAGFYPMMLASSICLFGGSWLGSSLLKSAAYALLIGVALTGAAGGAISSIQVRLKLADTPALEHTYQVTFLVLGIAAFAAGTIHFLRRVEP